MNMKGGGGRKIKLKVEACPLWRASQWKVENREWGPYSSAGYSGEWIIFSCYRLLVLAAFR
jgi:hypothetical protein